VKGFNADFSYLDIKERIEYFAVFGGFWDLESLHVYESLEENIIYNILGRYDEFKSRFSYTEDSNLQNDLNTLLFRIAVGDRKSHSIYKNDITQPRGKELYKFLFDKKIINKEYSRERTPVKLPGLKLKKELRRYKIEDKILFRDNFTRFWFTFINPNQKKIEKGDFAEVSDIIKKELDKFISFTFESLSNELIKTSFKNDPIVEAGSYWDKEIELDLLAKTRTDTLIAGECKWKNQRISKNILNKLQKKCEIANFDVDYFALFSKSGFSNELQKMKNNQLLLYDLEDFNTLL